MKLKLPADIVSSQDLNELILEIKQYSSWHSHNSVKKQAGAKSSQLPDLSKVAGDIIDSFHGKKEPSVKSLDKLIEALEDYKDTAQTITVTLAAPPHPKLKSQLTDWCRKHLREEVLVDFSFDSTLLGGMVVRSGSHIYDWSFRRQILLNRYQFTEVLRRV